MGYICPQCSDGLEDEEGPCQAAGDGPGDLNLAGSAKRQQDQRRRNRMRAAGPVESFTAAEVGHRDAWLCGICQDTARLVDPEPSAPLALSPSVDHIVPVSGGGQHARTNVRITHLWCNVERNSGGTPDPEYMRARLSYLLDGSPVPEELHRSRFPSWQWPASPWIEYMIALYITAAQVTADPRYGDPATRLASAARQLSGEKAEDTMHRGLERIARVTRRRSRIDAKWRSPR
jgi:hypothetical protein